MLLQNLEESKGTSVKLVAYDSKVKKPDDRGRNKEHIPKIGSKFEVASETASKSKNDDLVASKLASPKKMRQACPKPPGQSKKPQRLASPSMIPQRFNFLL